MVQLNVFLIDVAWGDSIFIESVDGNGDSRYAMIDCNDTKYDTTAQRFVAKYLDRKGIDWSKQKPVFDFVLLTHWHLDHGQGLKALMQRFGTRNFYYPKGKPGATLSDLLQYGNRSSNVQHHQAIDDTKIMPNLGEVSIELLWPPHNHDYETHNENSNSTVMALTLGQVAFVLTGDAEADVWHNIAGRIPANTGFFKVPHHGSINGTMDGSIPAAWYNAIPLTAKLGISSHIRPYRHPHDQVINLFDKDARNYYRTDRHYHLAFSTDGIDTMVQYSHV